MNVTPRLDAYHTYEQEWESYEHLTRSFEWDLPETFNLATYVCDRWAQHDSERDALYIRDDTREKGTYTFTELQTAANRLANHLREEGVERGDRIGVNLPQKPETIITHLAVWKLGGVSVPLSTLFGPDAIQYRLADSGAVACVVDESMVDTVRSVRSEVDTLATVLVVGDAEPEADEREYWAAQDGHDESFETVRTTPDDDAAIFYTSGTTGDPKGVRHAHRVLLGELALFVPWFMNMQFDEDDVYWTPGAWSWMGGLFNVVLPGLFYGVPIVGWNERFDAAAAFDLLETYEVTNCWIPPTALRMMMQIDDASNRFDVSSVRVLASGGEALGESIVDWAGDVFDGVAVHEGYGQTEANMTVGGCEALGVSRPGKIGKPAPGHEVRIVDPDTAQPLVEPGEVGEIAVKYEGNPVCFKEYWNEPEKTAAKLADGWLLTEDLGTMDDDGYVEFVSRKDDVIISSGYRIGPEEVEDSLATHEAVADAGVIGVADAERGTVPKAFVQLAAGYNPSAELVTELQQHVKTRLAKYEYPRAIEFVAELPTTATGKVRRADLRTKHDG